jgi:hypothetical protein
VDYLGLVADAAQPLPERGLAPYGQVRFLVRGAWSAWQAVDQDGAQARGHFTGALVDGHGATAYQVRGLPAAGRHWRAAAINTTDGPALVVGHRRAATAAAATPCRSRADWGADESLTAWSKGTDVQSYYPVQVLTVHHTAGSNDPGQDYAATVRAIYSYHVTTNGWSDIGYNELIDGNGVVYEGRNAGHTSASCLYGGGTGSDFAHQTSTDDVVTGAHVAGYNAGNLGIALLGCFDASSACSGSTQPTSAAVSALEDQLASLSTRHHLDPQGTVTYTNPVTGTTATEPTVPGHRDFEATACPGGNLYAQLPAIRAAAAARMTSTSPAPSPSPSTTATAAPATITSTSCSGASCSFTGTGTGVLSWAFGNGRTATGSSVSTKYSSPGTYAVTLTDGAGSTASRAVTCTSSKNQLRCST